MTERERLLSRDEVLDALRLLGGKLHHRGKRAELYIFGGRCMMLGFKRGR